METLKTVLLAFALCWVVFRAGRSVDFFVNLAIDSMLKRLLGPSSKE